MILEILVMIPWEDDTCVPMIMISHNVEKGLDGSWNQIQDSEFIIQSSFDLIFQPRRAMLWIWKSVRELEPTENVMR